jgi:hypothetical protein
VQDASRAADRVARLPQQLPYLLAQVVRFHLRAAIEFRCTAFSTGSFDFGLSFGRSRSFARSQSILAKQSTLPE